jgi:hypothetical protein
MMKRQGIVAAFVVAALALGAGCGGKSEEKSKFIGSWTVSSGSLTGTCTNLGSFTQPLTGEPFTVDKGTTSDLVVTLNGCMVNFDLDGHSASATSASAQAGQSCNFAVPGFGGVVVSIGTWTLQLSNSDTIAMTMSGSALTNCPVSGSGTATRAAPDAGAGG